MENEPAALEDKAQDTTAEAETASPTEAGPLDSLQELDLLLEDI